jgi:hypothetical protein
VPRAKPLQTSSVPPKAKASAPSVTADIALPPRTLDRFRAAMKFSLWTWALYWPGGGLLLMVGGLDPISISITLLSLAAFVMMLATGALRADSSRTIKEFLIERPLYLVVALAAFVALAAVVPNIESFALLPSPRRGSAASD